MRREREAHDSGALRLSQPAGARVAEPRLEQCCGLTHCLHDWCECNSEIDTIRRDKQPELLQSVPVHDPSASG